MDKCCQTANLYLATLKAMQLIHQHNHWTSKGKNFYSHHLLFERIYETVGENLDLAAEKFIGVLGDDCLDYNMQTSLLNKVLEKYKKMAGDEIRMSLAIEKDFLKYSKYTYDCLEEENRLSLGLDDMIMSIASEREEAVYLLSQTLDNANSSDDE